MSEHERWLREWVLKTCQDLGLSLQHDEDDFFAAGGTSLTAARLIGRAEEAFGEDALPAEDLFVGSTVGELVVTLTKNVPVKTRDREN
ncbi:phosphopantetheine-binding protein [Embleya sp. NBC_00888]|uniref:phosphopantetheine-binding protein n=1 Tax=Embleya sp. NBC_00888 TaxID=2975960 RepID=UPI0038693DB0|nr:phosphopantetheine-binding protein [Embleya sp. NBC_00888]